jgi:S-adenosylmethionine hydrolase
MLVIYTDFGPGGPYTGQMQAVLVREAPGVPIISLFDDLPAGLIQAAAYLLPAYVNEFAAGDVFLCVVDPGVGTSQRESVVLQADGRWFVAPDNGLLNILAARACERQWWSIDWRPAKLSASFHGRDLFAPVAAMLARGETPPGEPLSDGRCATGHWPEDLAKVIYLDPFGNAMTGLRAKTVPTSASLRVTGTGRELRYARTFAEVGRGQAFWYRNANGLVELAVNRGRAAEELGLAPGSSIEVL